MLPAIYYKLDHSKILLSGNELIVSAGSVNQDQTAQNVQSDLGSALSGSLQYILAQTTIVTIFQKFFLIVKVKFVISPLLNVS